MSWLYPISVTKGVTRTGFFRVITGNSGTSQGKKNTMMSICTRGYEMSRSPFFLVSRAEIGKLVDYHDSRGYHGASGNVTTDDVYCDGREPLLKKMILHVPLDMYGGIV